MKKDVIGKLFGRYKQLTAKAKDFSNELSSHKVIEKDLTSMLKCHRNTLIIIKQYENFTAKGSKARIHSACIGC